MTPVAGPDAPEEASALHALRRDGHRLHTLLNAPMSTAHRLLQSVNALPLMDSLMSVERQSLWKPAPDSCRDAVSRARATRRTYLVAAHPWDLHGAARAGRSTVSVDRRGATYPAHCTPPDITVPTLEALREQLARDRPTGAPARHD